MKKIIFTAICFTIMFSWLTAQPPIKQINFNDKYLPLRHWMSPSEASLYSNYNRDFSPTDPPAIPVRSIAEFEPMEAVFVAYPLGVPLELIAEMSQDIKVITIASNQNSANQALNEYTANGVNTENCEFFLAATDSYWTRDYGPWFIFDGNNEYGIVDYPYNRPRPYDDEMPITYAAENSINLFGMNIEHTGGNYMTDGMGIAVSTDVVSEENTNLSDTELHTLMEEYLGINTYYVTEDPLGDYIKHVDCWGKFLDVDKILIGQVAEDDPRYSDYEEIADFFANQLSSYGTPYQVFRVFSPGNEGDPWNWNPYITPYTNSLILNNKVFVPLAGEPFDDDAIAVYEEAMPGYEIIGIQNSWLWENTDALHCRTHEIPDQEMLYIHHIPVLPEVDADSIYTIQAYVYPYSGEELIEDSLRVIYKVNDSEFSSVVMSSLGNNNYEATLNNLVPGDQVAYYIRGIDQAGKSANHPYIGAPDPHTFTIAGADTAPPTIIHEAITQLFTTDLPYTFLAEITDASEIANVYMEYQINDSEVFTLNMINDELDIWTCDWNETVDAGDVITYKIIAEDSAEPSNIAILPEDGTFSFSIVSVDNNDNHLNKYSKLIGSYPNPFNINSNIRSNTIKIQYYLSESENVDLSIYNVKGQIVKNIKLYNVAQGYHKIEWDAKDNHSKECSTGIYFIKMNTNNSNSVEKILLMK